MRQEMWEHYCRVERTEMGVGKNEPCNWCGLTEEAYNSLQGETKLKFSLYKAFLVSINTSVDD